MTETSIVLLPVYPRSFICLDELGQCGSALSDLIQEYLSLALRKSNVTQLGESLIKGMVPLESGHVSFDQGIIGRLKPRLLLDPGL